MDSIAEPVAKPKTKAVFDWADPFGLEAQLSEDERMVRIPPEPMQTKSWHRVLSKPFARKKRCRYLPRDGQSWPIRGNGQRKL